MLFFTEYLGLLGLGIIVILFFMVIIGAAYSFIKFVRLYCSMAQELRENMMQQKKAIQQLSNDEREIKGQNLARDAKRRLLSFKESLFLWPKECKILFFISLILIILQPLFSIGNLYWWKSEGVAFITLLLGILSLYAFLLSPLIGVFLIRLTGKLRKVVQQLEEATEQRDEALRIKSATGGKDDQ